MFQNKIGHILDHGHIKYKLNNNKSKHPTYTITLKHVIT